jgi:hypothetical protein
VSTSSGDAWGRGFSGITSPLRHTCSVARSYAAALAAATRVLWRDMT